MRHGTICSATPGVVDSSLSHYASARQPEFLAPFFPRSSDFGVLLFSYQSVLATTTPFVDMYHARLADKLVQRRLDAHSSGRKEPQEPDNRMNGRGCRWLVLEF
jgi:hypothetical protein